MVIMMMVLWQRLAALRRWGMPSLRLLSTLGHKSSGNDDFLTGFGSNYIDEMYREWKKSPEAVHASWRAYFKGIEDGLTPQNAFSPVPASSSTRSVASDDRKDILDHLKVQLLVRAYQVRGHLRANLDPLSIMQPEKDFGAAPELDPEFYGFDKSDMKRQFLLGEGVLPRFTSPNGQMSLQDMMVTLRRTYCGTIGYEFTHIEDRTMCNWIRARIEVPTPYSFSVDEKRVILDRLIWADSFERFVASKYPAEKRFGLEGGEALIPGMKALIDRSVEHGVQAIVMGMSHRGRLNVLNNVIRKPTESIFCEFMGIIDPSIESSGDVKYHLGMSYERPTPSGKRISISLVANPSHLEAVDPVVQGKVRAMQFGRGDGQDARGQVIGVLLHGDAAFSAQGVVYETLGMSQLPSYTTGGTIHIIVNNQIGFTTDPRFARSTPYPSDIAKSIDAPILHVNADDPEAVVHVFKLAADWRNEFHRDVVIDLVCYRRHGHNEVDQPAFTQPRMYAAIASQPPALEKYGHQLVAQKDLSEQEINDNKRFVWSHLEKMFEASKNYTPTIREWMTSSWNGFKSPLELHKTVVNSAPTGVPKQLLREIGGQLCTIPKDLCVHKGIGKIMEQRLRSIEQEKDIDMPTAEALAFGTLLTEGIHVRLSGQDVERGTFSQRHAVVVDQEKEEKKYVPLSNLARAGAPFTVCNSSLSEYGILGFELGYSLVSPNQLVLWEAQFGDFCNASQVIIDQYITSGEDKWLQRTGLTLLLPHGYDGAGPEHSNCHLERFLSLCDDSPFHVPPSPNTSENRQLQDCNIQVVYPSTPASYFHALRRQVHRQFRKPLILLTSKSLLRHPMARSELRDMAQDTRFSWLIDEPATFKDIFPPDKIDNVVFCSGQVYYALVRARAANRCFNTVIVRLEQLSPFPHHQVASIVDRYSSASHLTWCQEEPLNLGAWSYVEPRFEHSIAVLSSTASKGSRRRLRYAGREPTAAVATGYKVKHVEEEELFIGAALFPGRPVRVDGHEHGVPIYK